jgi:hypothetical protein
VSGEDGARRVDQLDNLDATRSDLGQNEVSEKARKTVRPSATPRSQLTPFERAAKKTARVPAPSKLKAPSTTSGRNPSFFRSYSSLRRISRSAASKPRVHTTVRSLGEGQARVRISRYASAMMG